MLRALNSWLYDIDPLALVAFERPLGAVKSAIRIIRAILKGL
jgi:hypothetical protein